MHGHPLGDLHLFVAMAALLLGAAVIFARKATRTHVWLGRSYAVAMIAVNVSALAIYELFGTFGPFHYAAVFSLMTLVAGWLPARRGARRPGWLPRHAYFMTGSYVGLVAAAVAETSTRYLNYDFGRTVLVASLTVFVVGLALMFRFVPPLVGQVRR